MDSQKNGGNKAARSYYKERAKETLARNPRMKEDATRKRDHYPELKKEKEKKDRLEASLSRPPTTRPAAPCHPGRPPPPLPRPRETSARATGPGETARRKEKKLLSSMTNYRDISTSTRGSDRPLFTRIGEADLSLSLFPYASRLSFSPLSPLSFSFLCSLPSLLSFVLRATYA